MEAMEAEEAAAEAEEGGHGGEGAEERFHSILPYSGPTVPDHIKARLANRRVASRRVASQHRPQSPRRPIKPVTRTSRPYPSRSNGRRTVQKRSDEWNEGVMGRSAATAMPVEENEGVMGLLARTGYQVLEHLKKFLLKEVQTGAVGKGMKNFLEEAADFLTEEVIQELDPDGCLQKLLCQLQERSHDSLTPEEGVLTSVFRVKRPQEQCAASYFPLCVLNVKQLEALLPPVPPRNTNAIP